jgi:hypothetical protein
LVVNLFRDETTTLLITFLFTVLELLFTTPLLRELLEGAEDLGIRFECRIAMDHAETVRTALTVFLWARCLGAVLPEVFCLWDPMYTGEFPPNYVAVHEGLVRAKLVATVFQLLLVAAFAVAVGLRLRALFLGAAKDRCFTSRLAEEWESRIGSKAHLVEQLHTDKALGWLVVAALFSIRPYLNRLNYFPDFLFFVMLFTALRHLPASLRRAEKRKPLLWVCALVAAACFALRTYGAAVFYPYFGEQWQALWAVYPAGLLSALSLGVGLWMLIGMLDDCSLFLYGRRRVKTLFLKVTAVLISLCAFVEYALPSLFDCMRLVWEGFPLHLKRVTEYVNVGFSALGVLCCAVFLLRVWVLSSAMRSELKLEMKL